MKKIILSAVLAIVMILTVFTLASCKNDEENPSLIGTTTPEETTTKAPETTPGTTTEHVHAYVESVVEPTCTEAGYTLYVCSCGDSKVENVVEKKPHEYTDWTIIKAPTCTSEGEQTRKCKNCDSTDSQVIQKADHNYIDVITPPTKTTQGYTVHTCSVCHASYTDSYTNATGSIGLSYTPNADGTVTISGLGLCLDSELIIYSTTTDGKTVSAIAPGAFMCCTGIKTIYLPASVTSIGEGAFAGCTSLMSITVETANKNYSDVSGVLYSKDQKTLVAFPAGRSETEYTVADSIDTILPSAFAGCTNLQSFKLSNMSSTKFFVEDGVLYALTKRTVTNTATNTTSFQDVATLIAYPAGKTATTFTSTSVLNNVNNVVAVGGFAFFGAKNLTSIDSTWQNKLETIGNCAFAYCTSLQSLTIPDTVTSIGDSAYAACVKLETLSIGSKVKTIGAYAFESCPLLKVVEIPNSVETIGEGAFANCSKIAYVVIGSGVNQIGANAFIRCSMLAEVFYRGNETSWFRVSVHESNNIVMTIMAKLYFYADSSLTSSTSADSFWKEVDGKIVKAWSNDQVVVPTT